MKKKIDPREIYADIKVRAPLVVRADGRGFNKLLRKAQKPYDIGFAQSLTRAARSIFQDSGLGPILAFTFSDEVNFLFMKVPFNGRLEKLDSVVASALSSALSLEMGRAVSMDARAIPLCPGEIADYLSERQDEAWRNCVFSYGFYALIDEGRRPREAMEHLRGIKERDIHEMLFLRGTNLAKKPAWQRRGILIYREAKEVLERWDPPLFGSDEGRQLIQQIITGRYSHEP